LNTRNIVSHLKSTMRSTAPNGADFLRPFGDVQTLQIDSIGNGFVEQLSRCLELDDGEPPLELLPELQELTYSGSVNYGDAFTSFVEAHQNAGRPMTLVR
jgi:hypothetical protein